MGFRVGQTNLIAQQWKCDIVDTSGIAIWKLCSMTLVPSNCLQSLPDTVQLSQFKCIY
jgi:hypothetical protein